MSWNVGDDEWLADPAAAPTSGPVDSLDDRAIGALATGFQPTAPAPEQFAGNIPTLVATKVAAPFQQPPDEGLPPPPYSAAFDADDADSYTSSYESGSFVADSEAVPSGATEPEPDFHIPTLTLGVVQSRPEPEPEPASEPAGFVIPTLSAAPASVAEEGFEEVQADDFEEVGEAPVRTGETVVARAPEPSAAAEPEIGSVHDDDDAGALVIPELVERIDSAELVLEPDPTPSEPDADSVVEAPAAAEHTGFVIPTLARSEGVDEETPADDHDTDDDDDAPVVGITAAEILLPLLARPAAEAQAERSGEELPEVDAESIESLDAADLEEVEQPIAVAVAIEPEEARPPAPPEAKAQGKRRKAWYDDVFAEHFLFLYPLTWEETCQRDAQFIFEQLAGREELTVLDVGCGEGSHAVELAKLGARVTGIDNSLAQLLAAAQTKEAADIEDGRVEFIHGDMRRLPRDREFDAVMCIGTTLGYFEEEQNWLCLQEMHDRLRPGGRLLIHVFNRDFVAPHLPSRSWWQGKRCMVIDEAEMNFFANRLRVHRTIIFDDGRQYEHYMFMRAYTVQDLGKAISQLGMRVIEVSGSRDTRGRFFGSASPDIWITAEKK